MSQVQAVELSQYVSNASKLTELMRVLRRYPAYRQTSNMGRHVPYRIEVGKMVERWAKWDKAELLEQIGFIPAS